MNTRSSQVNSVRLSSLIVFGYSLVCAIAVGAGSMLVLEVRAEFVFAACILTILLASLRGVYRTRMVPDTTSMVVKITHASVVASALVLLASDPFASSGPDRLEFFLMIGGSWLAAVVGMFLGSNLLKRLWQSGKVRSRAIVVGTGRLTDELVLELRHRQSYGVDIVGVVSDDLDSDRRVVSSAYVPHAPISELAELVERTGADRLVVGPSQTNEKALVSAARWAAANGLPVFVVPRLFEMGVGLDSLSPDRVRGYPLVRVQRSAHPVIARIMKRSLDIAVSATALFLLSPIMAVCALAVRVSSPGPILFTQERVGQGGKTIFVSKFRSMTVNAGSDTEWTADSRVTAIGSFLRRSSLDELPQFFAILRGDMSLVGPRPERPAFVDEFTEKYPAYVERHRMPVGLTGLSQVVGLVGDTSIEERIKYDNLYIDQWSFGGDLQIMVKTVWSILRQPAKKREHKSLEEALSLRMIAEAEPLSRERTKVG